MRAPFQCILLLLLAISLYCDLCTKHFVRGDQEGSGRPVRTYEVDGVVWQQYSDPTSLRPFFYNLETGESRWTLPNGAEYDQSDGSFGERLPLLLQVVLLPGLGCGLLLGARILYLRHFYPEMLNPTKVRKIRKKGMTRPNTCRGSSKLSQDGKGGRSANS